MNFCIRYFLSQTESNIVIDFRPASAKQIFLKYCTKIQIWLHCNINVFSESYIIRGIGQVQKYSFTFLIEIANLIKQFYLNFAHKFIVDNKVIFTYFQDCNSSWVESEAKKNSLIFLIKIRYLTNQFCSNFAQKCIANDNTICMHF